MGNICGPSPGDPFGGDAQMIWLAAGRQSPAPLLALLQRLVLESRTAPNLFTVSATRWQAENASTRSSASEIFSKNPSMRQRVEAVESLELEANASCTGEPADQQANVQRFAAKLAAEAGKDPHISVGLLVDFLHKLQSPLLSPHVGDFEAFVAAVKRPSMAQRLVAIRAALSRLPVGHLAICKDLFTALRDCISSSTSGAAARAEGGLRALARQAVSQRAPASGAGDDDSPRHDDMDEVVAPGRVDSDEVRDGRSGGQLSSKAIAGVLAPTLLERVLIDAADVDHIHSRPDERFLAVEVVRTLIEYCDTAFGRANEEDVEDLLAQVSELQAGMEAERARTRERERELAQVEQRRVVGARVALDRQMMRRVISAWSRTAQRSRGRMALHDRVRLLSELLDHQARIAAHKDRLLERLAAETGNSAMLARLQEKGLLAPSGEPGEQDAVRGSAMSAGGEPGVQESKTAEEAGEERGRAVDGPGVRYRDTAPEGLEEGGAAGGGTTTVRAVPSSYAASRLSMPPMDSPVLRQQATRWQPQPQPSGGASGLPGDSVASAGKGGAREVDVDAMPDAPAAHLDSGRSRARVAAAPAPAGASAPQRVPQTAT